MVSPQGKGAMPAKLAVRSRKGILPLIPVPLAPAAYGVRWLLRARAAGSSVGWEKLVLWDSQKLVEHTLGPAAA